MKKQNISFIFLMFVGCLLVGCADVHSTARYLQSHEVSSSYLQGKHYIYSIYTFHKPTIGA